MEKGSIEIKTEGECDATRLSPEKSRVFYRTLLAAMLRLQQHELERESGDVASITCEDKNRLQNTYSI